MQKLDILYDLTINDTSTDSRTNSTESSSDSSTNSTESGSDSSMNSTESSAKSTVDSIESSPSVDKWDSGIDKEMIKQILQEFIPVGKQLPIINNQQQKLDENQCSFTTGTRKTSKAQVWIKPGLGLIYINGKPMNQVLFDTSSCKQLVEPFKKHNCLLKFNTWCIVDGGGTSG